MTIKQVKQLASAALTQKDAAFFLQESQDFDFFIPSPSPNLDIECILEFVLNKNKTYILMHPNEELDEQTLNQISQAVQKRRIGLPIAYITNHKEFYGFDFFVTPDVLIPKPDTEILVEKAIEYIKEKVFANPNKILTICDMCTGSGCIGLSVLKTLIEENLIPKNRIPKFVLVDISSKALDVAQKNWETLIPSEFSQRVQFVQSNLFCNVTGTFDVILTNPPYIPKNMVVDLLKDGRSEPSLALNGDVTEFGDSAISDDGLEIIRRLVPQAFEKLIYNGIMLMETGEYNAEDASELEKDVGFRNICIHKDLSGQLRVVEGIK